MLYCPMCGCPLKPQAHHCLECGEAIELMQAKPVAVAAPQAASAYPTYIPDAAPQAPAALASAGAAYPAYDPPLLQQWLEGVRAQRANGQLGQHFSLADVLVRIVYFVCVGSWLSQVWIILSWLMCLTLVGIPLGTLMVRMLPQIAFLVPSKVTMAETRLQQATTNGVAFPIRVIYFVLVGSWLSLVWMELAWALGLTIVGLPLAIMMLAVLPSILTLGQR